MSCFHRILGQSQATHEIYSFGQRAATVDAPVLLTGESGTGKGLLARAIHGRSRRASRPLVAVNCAGVPETLFEAEFFGHSRGAFTGAHETRRGLFEQAHGGTLFLDEIGEMPLPLQAKLLTALEDGQIRRLGAERIHQVDVRIIAATGADLEEAVGRGEFRRDLYHRLLVLSFRLPPLRQRDGDIDFLADHFLGLFNRKYQRSIRGFEPGVIARLQRYSWPGNVRELAHAIEAAVLACDHPRIRTQHLPQSILAPTTITVAGASTIDKHSATTAHTTGATAGAAPPPTGRYSFYGNPDDERKHILETLRRYHGNRTRTAAALGMARNTLRLKLRALDLEHSGR